MATERQLTPSGSFLSGPSPHQRWAFLLLPLAAAALLRFWQLGELPPGLYRDEAWNGLDALRVLQGEYPLYFPANNGREPTYIYLVALSIYFLGRSVLAIRLAAAIISTLTTLTTYLLAQSWFGWRVGLLSAWLWAITVWPMHLGRIGFRAVLLPFYLSLIFWLATEAYRRPIWWRWLLTGLVVGLSFYTYLAVQFTPVLGGVLLVYLWWRGRRDSLRSGLPWLALGTAITLAPLLWLMIQQPEIISGRAGQVSIFNQAINQGNFWGTVLRQIGQAIGLFFWQGDRIIRHNPPGRPLFDLFMLIPFLIGLGLSWQRRQQAVIIASWAWLLLMLAPTILSEDTPHFLRAVGILPVVFFIPALGLSQLASWNKLPNHIRLGLVIGLVAAAAGMSIRDYFGQYARQPETAYLFEAAARTMAEAVQAESQETTIFIDQRLWEGWPSIPFLLEETQTIIRFQPENGLSVSPGENFAVYLWPFAPHEFLYPTAAPAKRLTIERGDLARGDLDPSPLPFVVRYQVQPAPVEPSILVRFGDQFLLHEADVQLIHQHSLRLALTWGLNAPINQEIKLFVHLMENETILDQIDIPLGQGYWSQQRWSPGLLLQDQFTMNLSQPYNPEKHSLFIGLYDAATLLRLPVGSENDSPVEDRWRLR